MLHGKRFISLCAGLLTAGVVMAQATPPAGAPAGATGQCKDGTYWTGATKRGACHGHKGVQDWYGGSGPPQLPRRRHRQRLPLHQHQHQHQRLRLRLLPRPPRRHQQRQLTRAARHPRWHKRRAADLVSCGSTPPARSTTAQRISGTARPRPANTCPSPMRSPKATMPIMARPAASRNPACAGEGSPRPHVLRSQRKRK